jgi:hypothetical protein
LTADGACSNGQQIDDTGSGAGSGSDQSGSTGPQGSGAHGSSDHSGSTGPQGGAGEQDGSTGEQSGSWIPQLPLDIDYDSTPDGQVEDLFGDIEVVVDREVVSVPEPGTLVLLVTGLLGGLLVRRRQR